MVCLDPTPIGLRYLMPSNQLQGLVSTYYVFHANVLRYADLMRADMAQIRFMIRGSGRYRFVDHSTSESPQIALIGPSFGATCFDVSGPALIFGVVLRPAGWAALVCEDASLLADRLIDARALLGKRVDGLLDRMRHGPCPEQQATMADAVLEDMSGKPSDSSLWFARIVDRWLSGAGTPRVDCLVQAMGTSVRQVERLARRYCGAPPKILSRKCRALRAAALLVGDKASWQEAAGEHFCDQSHFIREVRQFTGLTPSQLVHHPTLMTRLIFGRSKPVALLPDLSLERQKI